jgi:hypothetical protein
VLHILAYNNNSAEAYALLSVLKHLLVRKSHMVDQALNASKIISIALWTTESTVPPDYAEEGDNISVNIVLPHE